MTDIVVTTVDSGPRRVTQHGLRYLPALPPCSLVADPHRHPELDGSGTVRDIPVHGPDRLSEGAKSVWV